MSRMYREEELQALGSRSKDIVKKDKSYGADSNTHAAGICSAGRTSIATFTDNSVLTELSWTLKHL